jgi:hypothetical protein
MSPGGRVPSSSRSLPVLPPLSIMETTALMWMPGSFLNPESRANWPLPPPMVTMWIGFRDAFDCFLAVIFFISVPQTQRPGNDKLQAPNYKKDPKMTNGFKNVEHRTSNVQC